MMRRRSGIALVIALVTLLALAGAVTASFLPAAEGRRQGERGARMEILAGAAELGLHRALAAVTAESLAAHPDPGPLLAAETLLAGAGPALRVRSVVTRLPAGTIWVASAAEPATGTGERRARRLLGAELTPRFPGDAALIARHAPVVTGGFTMSGADEPPDGWTGCGPRLAELPASYLTADPATWTRFGPDSLAGLLARAMVLDSASRTGPLPRAPALRVAGGASIGPGAGAGVLIAEGPLDVVGPFRFDGVLIALDSLRVGVGSTLHGLVIAAGGAPRLEGPGELRRSQCAVLRAERALSRVILAPRWSWGITY